MRGAQNKIAELETKLAQYQSPEAKKANVIKNWLLTFFVALCFYYGIYMLLGPDESLL